MTKVDDKVLIVVFGGPCDGLVTKLITGEESMSRVMLPFERRPGPGIEPITEKTYYRLRTNTDTGAPIKVPVPVDKGARLAEAYVYDFEYPPRPTPKENDAVDGVDEG